MIYVFRIERKKEHAIVDRRLSKVDCKIYIIREETEEKSRPIKREKVGR